MPRRVRDVVSVRMRGGPRDGAVEEWTRQELQDFPDWCRVQTFVQQLPGDREELVALYWIVERLPGRYVGVYDPVETAKRRK